MKLLFRQLLRSSDKESYVNEANEEQLFNALIFIESDKTLDENKFDELWNNWIKVILKPRSALIVVDVQNDFVDRKNGRSYVIDGERVVPIINELIQTVPFDAVVYTYDWHPRDHCSFIESVRSESVTREIIWSNKPRDQLQVGDLVRYAIHSELEQQLWPQHCVRNTEGAKFYKDLFIVDNAVKVAKGFNSEVDSYSGFKDNLGLHYTLLNGELDIRGITDIYLSGVTYDYCVGNTARDGLSLGYRTAMIEDASQQVTDEGKNKMRKELKMKGASLVMSNEVMDMVNGRDRKLEMALFLARTIFVKDTSPSSDTLQLDRDEL